MPVFRFSKAFGIGRDEKVFLNLQCGVMRGVVPEIERCKKQAEELRNARERIKEQKETLRSKEREILKLKNELHIAKERVESAPNGRAALQAAVESEAGALPDFVIIGAQKCGTGYLYDLLTQHPHVERALFGRYSKELHYFNRHFDEGIEWYRRCFPPPRWKDGRRSITGEATPKYLFHPSVPERMARVLPRARLIVLLRNPVDRAYSHYQHAVRDGHESRSFVEAIEAALNSVGRPRPTYLARGIYVDQLLRWAKFYGKEQMLVLKSERFFERTRDTLNLVVDFLGLPQWEPETLPYNVVRYQQQMDPATRQRLEDYFAPHNRRLYEYLGVDFGW